HLGIKVLPPDVNESAEDFEAVGEDIRFGMGAIRNVGSEVVESIIEARREKGAFKSFSDYLDKISLVACTKRVTESLIKAGAVDSVQSTKKAADKGQFDLFASLGGDDDGAVSTFAIDVPEDSWDRKHELALEREMLGLYVSGHPLDGFEDALAAQTDTALTTV